MYEKENGETQKLLEHFRLDVCYKEYCKDRMEINDSLTVHVMFKSSMEYLLYDSIQWKATPGNGVRTRMHRSGEALYMTSRWSHGDALCTQLLAAVVFHFNLEIWEIITPV